MAQGTLSADATVISGPTNRGRWHPKFWQTVTNPTAPGAQVDMYGLLDEQGNTVASLGVLKGDTETPKLVCDAVNAWRESHQ